MPDDPEDPNVKHAQEQAELQLRLLMSKRIPDDEFTEMLNNEKWTEDKVALLKSRAAEWFKNGELEAEPFKN